MGMTVFNQGEGFVLEYLVNKFHLVTGAIQTSNLELRLFTNNIALPNNLTEASFTEPSSGGYAPIELEGTDWTITPGSPSQAVYPQQTFSFSAAIGNVYGYWIARVSDGKAILAELFSNPANIAGSGDSILITPKITAASVTND